MTDTDVLATALKVTAQILSRRLLLISAMATTFFLAVWAMASPSWEHAGVAGGYAVMAWVFVNLPDLFAHREG